MNTTPNHLRHDPWPKMRLGWAAAAMVLAFALACGGGGGSSSAKPGASPNPVHASAAPDPTILGITPNDFRAGQEVSIELDRWEASDELYIDGKRIEVLSSSQTTSDRS